MSFTEYPTKDGQRVAETLQATHDVRCAIASLQELLEQIGEQEQVLQMCRTIAKEEVRKATRWLLSD